MFPMIPLDLSTDLTSLNEGGDRLAMVTEMDVSPAGHVEASTVYRAVVRNQAQLAYNGVGAWLEGRGPAPAKVAASPDLQAQLRLQHEASNALSAERQRRGALNLETIEIRAVMHGGDVVDVERHEKNEATELIEDFMIAVNGVVARLLDDRHLPSIRRVVRTPKRWDRIVTLAATFGARLPAEPTRRRSMRFCSNARRRIRIDSPTCRFRREVAGPGRVRARASGREPPGHFGLAVEDYTHSTAPNRRFADLVTQRLVKAALAKQPVPYSEGDLDAIARNCTLKEDAANKVERDMSKRIAAAAMSHRVGETFDAIVTGASPKGTFVRVLQPRVEGLLVHPGAGVDVGDRLRVTLAGPIRSEASSTSSRHAVSPDHSFAGLRVGALIILAGIRPGPARPLRCLDVMTDPSSFSNVSFGPLVLAVAALFIAAMRSVLPARPAERRSARAGDLRRADWLDRDPGRARRRRAHRSLLAAARTGSRCRGRRDDRHRGAGVLGCRGATRRRCVAERARRLSGVSSAGRADPASSLHGGRHSGADDLRGAELRHRVGAHRGGRRAVVAVRPPGAGARARVEPAWAGDCSSTSSPSPCSRRPSHSGSS